jgi:hypothetical protein
MESHICDEGALNSAEAYNHPPFYSNSHIFPARNLIQDWRNGVYPVDCTRLARSLGGGCNFGITVAKSFN